MYSLPDVYTSRCRNTSWQELFIWAVTFRVTTIWTRSTRTRDKKTSAVSRTLSFSHVRDTLRHCFCCDVNNEVWMDESLNTQISHATTSTIFALVLIPNLYRNLSTAIFKNIWYNGSIYAYVHHVISAYSFFHLVVCLTTGPKLLPNPALHVVRSRASSFRCEYLLPSLRSSSSFLRLLRRLPVTYIPPFTFPSITCCRRQFLRNIWPIQVAFRLLISCRIFLCSLTLGNTY
jgi:hypothetical protein